MGLLFSTNSYVTRAIEHRLVHGSFRVLVRSLKNGLNIDACVCIYVHMKMSVRANEMKMGRGAELEMDGIATILELEQFVLTSHIIYK